VTIFLQQVIIGLANGAIYASMALALVLIYKGTGVLNVAQGEMALFSAYIAWDLNDSGVALPIAVGIAVFAGFVGGGLLRLVVAPVQKTGGDLSVLIVTLGVFLGINSLAGYIWGNNPLAMESLFSDRVFHLTNLRFSAHQLGMVVTILVMMAMVTMFFRFTRAGLYMRAAAENAPSARLAGLPVGLMLALGWGLASAVGAVGGILITHQVFLSPPVMFGVLLWSVAAAILGGFDSPFGAVVGGIIVGQLESLGAFYIDIIGNDLKIVAAIAVIIGVLIIRPQGLFGTPEVTRL
jgi:branched-chain amino acid transport system permease protein